MAKHSFNAEDLRRIREQANETADAERAERLARIREQTRMTEKKPLTGHIEAVQAAGKKREIPPSFTGRDQSREGYLIAALLIIGSVLFLVYGLGYFDTTPPEASLQATSVERQLAPMADKTVQPAENVAQAPQPSAKAEQPAKKPEAASAKAQPPAPATAKQDAEPGIRNAVTQWAEAWSRRDASAYLAFYAGEFKPPQGLSRPEWETQRKSKLAKYKSIEVTLKNIKVTHSAGDEASVSFTQDFKGDSFKELGTKKELRLKKIQDHWMIVSENAK